MLKKLISFYLSCFLAIGSPSVLIAQGFEANPLDSLPSNLRGGTDFGQGTVSVHVLGEVMRPATYFVHTTDRLTVALQYAGGLKPSSSETRIELRRGKNKNRVCDILELNRNGDLKNNPFLQENDVIFVPRKEAAIFVQGTVKYPGMYEISAKGTTTLQQALDMAQGFTVGLAVGKPILVIRYEDSNERKTFEIPNEKAALNEFHVIDGDTVHSPHKFTINNQFDNSVGMLPNDQIAYPSYSREVFILGGVKAPGKFPFVPQHRLNKYIAMAGGLSRLGRTDAVLYRTGGGEKVIDINSNMTVNPGDTIVVGEDQMGPDFWLTFLPSIASLGLSAYAILKK